MCTANVTHIISRFFGFGGPIKKKSSTCNPPNLAGLQSLQQQQCTSASTMGRRRGSDRSLSGSVHELAVSGVREVVTRVSHSHSQSNLSDIPYRYVCNELILINMCNISVNIYINFNYKKGNLILKRDNLMTNTNFFKVITENMKLVFNKKFMQHSLLNNHVLH